MKKPPSYIIRISTTVLHNLLTRVAQRAYEAGHKDGAQGTACNSERVRIDPQQLRKLL